MAQARRAAARVTYMKAGSGSNQSAAVMAEYTEGFSYTDPASEESDTVSITLSNIDLRWAGSWLPQTGDKITAEIVLEDWEEAGQSVAFPCGKFCLDDLSFRGPEYTCTIGGVSVPEGNSIRSTERSKTWQEVTLKEIGAEIAGKYHLLFDYTGNTIKLGTVEQNQESDSSFLSRICKDYGMAFKIYSGKVIIYDKGEFETRAEITIITAGDMQDWSYNTTLTGTYTGAEIRYTSGSDDEELTCVVGGGNRILNINEKVESLQEAQIMACARVNAENEKAETMNCTIMADTRIVAGSTVGVKGLNRIDGKYFVDKATHSIGADGAYTMSLEMHKCQKRITGSVASQGTAGNGVSGLAVGDKVIVNGPAYWGGNGGRANQCSNMVMYITEILGSGYEYQYGVSRRQGGTRYGWCAVASLSKG